MTPDAGDIGIAGERSSKATSALHRGKIRGVGNHRQLFDKAPPAPVNAAHGNAEWVKSAASAARRLSQRVTSTCRNLNNINHAINTVASRQVLRGNGNARHIVGNLPSAAG